MDNGTECTLSNFAGDAELCSAANTWEGRAAIHRDLDMLEGWARVYLMMFHKANCKMLQLGWGNPKQKCKQYRLGRELSEREKMLVAERLHTAQQCPLTDQKAN